MIAPTAKWMIQRQSISKKELVTYQAFQIKYFEFQVDYLMIQHVWFQFVIFGFDRTSIATVHTFNTSIFALILNVIVQQRLFDFNAAIVWTHWQYVWTGFALVSVEDFSFYLRLAQIAFNWILAAFVQMFFLFASDVLSGTMIAWNALKLAFLAKMRFEVF